MDNKVLIREAMWMTSHASGDLTAQMIRIGTLASRTFMVDMSITKYKRPAKLRSSRTKLWQIVHLLISSCSTTNMVRTTTYQVMAIDKVEARTMVNTTRDQDQADNFSPKIINIITQDKEIMTKAKLDKRTKKQVKDSITSIRRTTQTTAAEAQNTTSNKLGREDE